MGEVRGRGVTVDEAFANFVTWRSYIIKAFISEDKLFRKTIVVEEERHELEVKLDDELLALLPPSTMPLSFTCREISEREWLNHVSVYCGAWLESIALNSDGLHKDDRKLLFKEINKLSSIREVCLIVGQMKVKAQYPKRYQRDEDAECYACRNDASCVFWIWCGTCKEDIFRCYCNSCSMDRWNECESCSRDFTMVVRCSDNFHFCYLH